MARGSIAKEEIVQKILKEFEGSFQYDKEIRIPMEENGERVEIKVTLTCAKVNVGNAEAPVEKTSNDAPAVTGSPELTEEEKNKVNDLIKKLCL